MGRRKIRITGSRPFCGSPQYHRSASNLRPYRGHVRSIYNYKANALLVLVIYDPPVCEACSLICLLQSERVLPELNQTHDLRSSSSRISNDLTSYLFVTKFVFLLIDCPSKIEHVPEAYRDIKGSFLQHASSCIFLAYQIVLLPAQAGT